MNITHQAIIILLFCLHFCCESPQSPQLPPTEVKETLPTIPYRAVDLSFLPEIETYAIPFSQNGTVSPALDIFKEYGVNLVRLRLWHSPASGHSDLDEVLTFAKRLKNNGLEWWLDIHYSDTWADPSQQNIPTAWQSLDNEGLKDSVFNYTKNVLTIFQNENCTPLIVQVGNEINHGMLWQHGQTFVDNANNWDQFVGLLNEGIRGVRTVDANIQIMLHHAGTEDAMYFYEQIQEYNIDYDLMGISYYGWWHPQDLTQLQTDLNTLAATFNKKIFIAETAYPFTLDWADWTHNSVGLEEHLISGYPASPEGQRDYLLHIREIVHNIPDEMGYGFCYWAPDWVAYKGEAASDASNGENLALFGFDFDALPALEAFEE